METKEICQKLNQFLDELNLGGKHRVNLSLFGVAADRLEKLEKENEAMMKELCEKEYLVREAEGRVQELEIQLDRQKAENPKWISVEDRLPEDGGFVAYYESDQIGSMTIISNYYPEEKYHFSHWISLPEPPKPKKPTFKDVFLKAFPKAVYSDMDCCSIFTKQFDTNSCNYICENCWNQPYFEEEGAE